MSHFLIRKMLGKWQTSLQAWLRLSHLSHDSAASQTNNSDLLIKVHANNYILAHEHSNPPLDLPPYRVAGIIILCFLTVVMVIANLLSICTIATNPILRQSSYYIFVFSLAVVDFLIGVVIMPIYIIWEYFGEWPFNGVSCDIVTALDIAFSDISTYSLVLIAVDKYIYITQPFIYHRKITVVRSCLLVAIVWIVWILFGFISMYGGIALDSQSKSLFSDPCIFIMEDIYNGVTACVAFVIPFTILTYTGVRIYCIAHLHLRKISRCYPVPPVIDTATFVELETHQPQTLENSHAGHLQPKQHNNGCRSSDASIRSDNLKKRTRFCKPLGTVVTSIVFFLFMCAPYWIATVSDIFCHCVAPWIYEDILAVVYNLNSLVNPFIYTMTDRPYRAAVKRLLMKCQAALCKRTSSDSHNSQSGVKK